MEYFFWLLAAIIVIAIIVEKSKRMVIPPVIEMLPPMKIIDEEFDINKKEHQDYLLYVYEFIWREPRVNHRAVPNFKEFHDKFGWRLLSEEFITHPTVIRIKDSAIRNLDDEKEVEKMVRELEEEHKKSEEEARIERNRAEAKRIFELKKNAEG